MRRDYFREKGYKIVDLWEGEWWRLYKTEPPVKQHLRESFLYKVSLKEEGFLQRNKDGKLLCAMRCLKEKCANFPPIFKNTDVSRVDNGPLMKEYAEKNNHLSQPRRMLVSSFHLTNGT